MIEEIQYKNVNGLITLCMAGGLIEVDPPNRHWQITQKFADLINEEIEKTLVPKKRKQKK